MTFSPLGAFFWLSGLRYQIGSLFLETLGTVGSNASSWRYRATWFFSCMMSLSSAVFFESSLFVMILNELGGSAFELVGDVTASLGVAQLKLGESAGHLFERADAALYEAKRSGRNRVVMAKEDAARAQAA